MPLAELEAEVPEALREMIELQLDALPVSDQRLLEAAAIVGNVFSLWAVAAVLAADAAALEEQCEELARCVSFIHPAGHDELPDGARSSSYVFAHSFYREVLYRRQPEARRSRGHQRLAERLSSLFAGAESSVASEMATHYEAAGNWMRAAQALAGMAAEKNRGRNEAVKLLRRALDLLDNLGAKERGAFEAELRARMIALGPEHSGAAKPVKARRPSAPPKKRAKS